MAEQVEKIVLGKKVDTGLNVYEQRFQMLMKLMRIDRMLKNAKRLPPH